MELVMIMVTVNSWLTKSLAIHKQNQVVHAQDEK